MPPELVATQVGDYPIGCPRCGEQIASPVFVEPFADSETSYALRSVVDLDPVRDHMREVHGVRLSRPTRR